MGFTSNDYNNVLIFFQKTDTKIYNLMKKIGYLQPPKHKNLFAILIGSIIGQKIRFTQARKQRQLLYIELGTDDFSLDDMINRGILFLQESNINNFTYDDIINKGFEYLRKLGIDETRTETIKRTVSFISTKGETYILNKVSDLTGLKDVKGIGDWTINCTKIMYSLGVDDILFDDCLLHQDLIIRRGIEKLYGIKEVPEIIKLSKTWSPWKGIVTWYLWKEFS